MGDLKTNWNNPGMSEPGLDGAGVTSRGGDPNIDVGGGAGGGLNPVWPDPFVPTPGGSETPNSVSGLPTVPSRFEPSATPPQPPTLQDRNPGTIDQQ